MTENEKRGKGRPTTNSSQITLRMPDEQIARVDEWISEQKIKPNRPEAIRYLVDVGLDAEKQIDGGNF